MGSLPRALVIEDARDSARLLDFQLRQAGFDVEVATTGADGLKCAAEWSPQLVVLDIGLPDLDGFAVCARLRKQSATAVVGVLMLSAHGLSEDRVKAFECGADDYLIKPFSVRELILRATALARRVPASLQTTHTPPPSMVQRCGAIELDSRTMEVHVSGQLVELRPSEIRLLQVFMDNPGTMFNRRDLLLRVWGIPDAPNARIVDVAMHRLRVALGDQAGAFETIRDGGYRLCKPPGAA